jgi:hypothetical protein
MQLRDGLSVCISAQQRAGDGLISFSLLLTRAIALSLEKRHSEWNKHLLR